MENSDNTMAWWWWSLWFSSRASPSTTEEEEMYEEGGAAPGERCGFPPTPSLYIGGRGEGAGPSRSHLEEGAAARGNPRWV